LPAPKPTLAANGPAKAQPPSKSAAQTQARPAAGCKGGSGPSSRSACSNANLAYLDHLSVVLYQQSFTNADAVKRSRLMRTRAEFLARLKGCSTDECRKAAYLSRNVEIVSIMRGQSS
jgi:uncharacterized protein